MDNKSGASLQKGFLQRLREKTHVEDSFSIGRRIRFQFLYNRDLAQLNTRLLVYEDTLTVWVCRVWLGLHCRRILSPNKIITQRLRVSKKLLDQSFNANEWVSLLTISITGNWFWYLREHDNFLSIMPLLSLAF